MPIRISNWDDPCEVYRALRQARIELTLGGSVAVVSYSSNGVARSTTFRPVDSQQLLSLMNEMRGECERLEGGRGRYAITAGAIRRRTPDDEAGTP